MEEHNISSLCCVVKFEVYPTVNDKVLDLVSATVTELTGRCTIEVIHIERAAVSHLNIGGPFTTP